MENSPQKWIIYPDSPIKNGDCPAGKPFNNQRVIRSVDCITAGVSYLGFTAWACVDGADVDAIAIWRAGWGMDTLKGARNAEKKRPWVGNERQYVIVY